ncbi:putative WD repeat-containing protein [Chlorella vulgaris]
MQAPPAIKSGRLELEVEKVRHEQVHQSRVAVLSYSADGARLWSGCEAAAPRLKEQAEEAPLVSVSCKDGSILQSVDSIPTANVRLICQAPSNAGGLLCVTGDGWLLHLNSDSGALLGSHALPNTPAEAAAAAPATPPPCDGTAAADGQQPDNSTEAEQAVAGTAAAGAAQEAEAVFDATVEHAAGPEFVAEDGYLFRHGDKGSGYYRKDVVRRYCASATVAVDPAYAPAAPVSDGAAAPAGGATQQALAESRQYIQRLMQAPPNMQSAITDAACSLLYTASLGATDTAVRVWRLHWSGGRDGGAPEHSSTSTSTSSCSCPVPELYHTLTGHTGPVVCMALSPDASLLVTGSSDRTIRVWSTAAWHCLRVLQAHGGGIKGLAVAPDGAMLYSAAADNTIRAWSMQHWVCLRTMHGRHDDTCWPACLALSPDGKLLASGSTGPFGASNIKVFQAGSGGSHEPGTCLATFAQMGADEKGDTTALLWSPDSCTLHAGTSNGTLTAWSLQWKASQARAGIRRGFL